MPQALGEHRPEFPNPAADRLVRDLDTALGEHVLDIPVAQREAQIQPDGMLDQHWRELMASVGDRRNGKRLSPTRLEPLLPVTLRPYRPPAPVTLVPGTGTNALH